MSADPNVPAWSEQFTAEAIRQLTSTGPLSGLTPEWAWGGSTGAGVRVAVVDSGVEYDHPALGGSVRGGVVVEYDETADNYFRIEPEEKPFDSAGHGTPAAGSSTPWPRRPRSIACAYWGRTCTGGRSSSPGDWTGPPNTACR